MGEENNISNFDAAYERETIINFNNAESTATYYTLNYHKRRELLKLAEKFPDDVRITKDDGNVLEAVFPKKWIKIRPPAQISEETRARLVESGKALAEMQRQAREKAKEK